MKYLRLTLDSLWRFTAHLEELAPRVLNVAGALSRLLSNIGEPREKTCRLYAGVVHSVTLYGTLIWAGLLSATAHSRNTLCKLTRAVELKIIRGYRTISCRAAGLLAGLSPLDLLAGMYAEAYYRIKILRRERGPALTAGEVISVRHQTR